MPERQKSAPVTLPDNPFVWKQRAEPRATPRDRTKLLIVAAFYGVWIIFLIWMATRS